MELPINYEEAHWTERRSARQEYIKLQEGKCVHCGELLDERPSRKVMEKRIDTSLFPTNFFNYHVHLHHNHETGLTIGAIHSRCNAVLWQYYGE